MIKSILHVMVIFIAIVSTTAVLQFSGIAVNYLETETAPLDCVENMYLPTEVTSENANLNEQSVNTDEDNIELNKHDVFISKCPYKGFTFVR